MKLLTEEEIAELRRLHDGGMAPPWDLRAVQDRKALLDGLPRLLDFVERSRALLKRIEWSGRDGAQRICPMCQGIPPKDFTPADFPGGYAGHGPDCELAALIGK